MPRPPPHPTLSIRVRFGGDDMMGPGKAALLDRIAVTGSIAAAARDMGMSYKRAWMLIETLNAMFDAPLVESSRGGTARGGAVLTERGRAVLEEYRAVEQAASAHAAPHLRRLHGWLRRSAEKSQTMD
ncbi:winged helix-turn-helix domain-containing protein [Rhodobacter calidifons]|uniref:LysR family transcriptional regulator n=1 Tax=Rhodobacter calidifons TaxID=2715277 RepID=A0ABX0G4C6_9RHOB|nr:winged helix-turn-helix domain-containing protein [Rhodobacter calidifons]NHB75817.1 LysR family transcriptional regulator [Rhodobacter calidifons]